MSSTSGSDITTSISIPEVGVVSKLTSVGSLISCLFSVRIQFILCRIVELNHLGCWVSFIGTYGINKLMALVMATFMHDQMNSVLFEERAKIKSY